MSKMLTLLLVLISLSAFPQNLVPNWSFEEYEECPEGINTDGIFPAVGWMSFRVTPDYFNTCSNHPESGVPINFFSEHRSALDGSGYAGFVQWHSQTMIGEVIAIQLSEPLEIGVTYYVSFYVSKGKHPDSNCWSDKVAARFTTSEYSSWPLDDAVPLFNSSHITASNFISDTIWTKVDGFFTADSNYHYLSIGNFYDIDHQNFQCDSTYFSSQAYYFVDCACVSTDQSDCDELLSIEENSIKNTLKVYPNPFIGEINVQSFSDKKVKKLDLYSYSGQLILTEVFETVHSEASISDLSKLPEGIYYLSVYLHNDQIFNYKLIKI